MFKRQDITTTVQVGTILRTVTRSKNLFDAVTLHHNISMRGGYLWIFSKEDYAHDFLTTFIIIINFFLFFLKIGRKADDDVLEWWKGQKQSLFIILGYFI